MARKKVETADERLSRLRENDLAMINRDLHNINEPTYEFNVGDEVRLGNLKDCVIAEKLYDGKVYGISCKVQERDGLVDFYRVAPWHEIYKKEGGDTSFAHNKNIDFNFLAGDIGGLIVEYYHSGIDMEPEYQRDYVWNLEDQQLLIDSIFNNIDIGKIALIRLDYDELVKRGKSSEVLDGKQRINAIISFYEGRIQYKGKYYYELSKQDQSFFKQHRLEIGHIENVDKETVLKYFLLLNKTGRVMDTEHLNKIEALLKESKKG